LEQLVHALESEPLFHASLGSKELFHSNLLAWFANYHRGAADAVFTAWTEPMPGVEWRPALREWRHLDLVIRLAEHAPLVIENKVFSPPREDQLLEYTRDAKAKLGEPLSFALLSLVAPNWSGGTCELDGSSWRHFDYGELSAAMRDATTDVEDEYARTTLERYAAIVEVLQEIADIVNEEIEPASDIRLPDRFAKPLDGVRLRQGFEKLRTRTIAYAVSTHLSSKGFDGSGVVDSYTRSWPLLEWFTDVPNTLDQIGWQMQEGQWRLAVRLRKGHPLHGRGSVVRGQREEYVAERYADWFDFTRTNGILEPGPADHGAYRGFEPDFVYLYRAAKTLTVGEVCDLAAIISAKADAFLK
jgi:hypothetical protein